MTSNTQDGPSLKDFRSFLESVRFLNFIHRILVSMTIVFCGWLTSCSRPDDEFTINFAECRLIEYNRLSEPGNIYSYLHYEYDEAGRVVQIDDEAGNIREFVYDENNRIVEIWRKDVCMDWMEPCPDRGRYKSMYFEYMEDGRMTLKGTFHGSQNDSIIWGLERYTYYEDSIEVYAEDGFRTGVYRSLDSNGKPRSYRTFSPQEPIDNDFFITYQFDDRGNMTSYVAKGGWRQLYEIRTYEYNYDLNFISIDPTPMLFTEHVNAIAKETFEDAGYGFPKEVSTYEYRMEEGNLIRVYITREQNSIKETFLSHEYVFSCQE